MYQDKTLTCKECGQDFVFTAREQEFFASKGFANEPGRCPACRSARKQRGGESHQRSREMYDAICSSCGAATQVPFRPSGDKPVYCRDCFQARRQA